MKGFKDSLYIVVYSFSLKRLALAPSDALTETLLTPFNVFDMYCFPKCITYISQAYSPSVNVREPWKYVHFAVRRARAFAL